MDIIKRDGRMTKYDIIKIQQAIHKAMKASGRDESQDKCRELAEQVEKQLKENYKNPSVEQIQDVVENVLMSNLYLNVAKQFILYRAERTKKREMNSKLMQTYQELTFTDANDSDMKRDNANIDGNTAMGTMLKYGSEGAKDFYIKFLLTPEQSEAHNNGDIHIHDFDFYSLTTTCCQIDLVKLFNGGFSTGHGFLREPNDIQSYAALACIAIQSNQNDQHGGQSVPNFDYSMAPGVAKTFKRIFRDNFAKGVFLIASDSGYSDDDIKTIFMNLETEKGLKPALTVDPAFEENLKSIFIKPLGEERYSKILDLTKQSSEKETNRAVFQAMEAFIHNLNTMHSRAGAQTPFSSINYGTDTSPEGRLVIKNILLAEERGLGFGETPIFPIHIFKIKEGVNYNPEDPNYDLFKLACAVSAKRLFPNFAFLDSPFNLQYYKPNHPETEVAYMGCRTRVIANSYNPQHQITFGRGNLSFTSINLPRIALRKGHDNISAFFDELQKLLDLVLKQLLDRFEIQCRKKVKNFPFLMGQGIWLGSDKLNPESSIREVLKEGTLSIGFIGLAETLKYLLGKHHGEDERARTLGLEIVSFMRHYCDEKSKELNLNITLLATPAEGLSGRFVKMDRVRFGVIEGVTDRDYYTNSFHVPVYYDISAFSKIQIEAPYHALTNAGHISYVELDGDMAKNTEAFEKVIRCMKEAGIGYGSINHPVDRDPICGYNGIINDCCPGCGRKEDEGHIGFERIRRITGYLVGTLDRFNDAKRAEEKDRVKHSASTPVVNIQHNYDNILASCT
ncbi:MAG: anaerobic ribonucleoside triphosphate reductase [Christensenellaceae bacterium]|jgi:ribonucleoside-triphosphate reductase|nr:anaerobic ribonucleoside triphosphate reductase [Christensenellaceae bacterium]